MNEEIKEKLALFPDNMNEIAKEAYYELENYITNLQEENKKLKETNEEHRKINGDLRKENQKLVKVIDELEFYIKLLHNTNIKQITNTLNSTRMMELANENIGLEKVIDKLTELKGGSDD